MKSDQEIEKILDEILDKFTYKTTREGSEVREYNLPEAKQAIAQLIKEGKISEFKKMIKMQEDYEKKVKEDREKGIYYPSFGSASGAIANAGWVNYFKDRIKELGESDV